MKEFFFPHRRVKSKGLGEVIIPIAKIFLYGKKRISLDVIVDSGAVVSLFPRSVCELLGLEFSRGKKSSLKTATGESMPIRIHVAKIQIDDFSLEARVGFSEKEKVPYILGRLDIFDKIEVRFDKEGTRFLIPSD